MTGLTSIALMLAILTTGSLADDKLTGLGDFCKGLPRAQYADYQLHTASDTWFQVYEVETGIFAIYEPWQWQEVISYLIIGEDKALVFDTGNGMGNFRAVIDRLTDLPLVVVNSHGHLDHVGGNWQFDHIVSIATDFTVERARGLPNAVVREEASPQALCKPLPAGVSEDSHHIKPFSITEAVKSGHKIDIGGRVLEIISVPGHTSDAVVLLDRDRGHMWTGDSYYAGPIWLFAPETDFDAYGRSIAAMAELAKEMKVLFPAHNVPRSDPGELAKVRDAFGQVMRGELEPAPAGDGMVEYSFPTFSFIMREGR